MCGIVRKIDELGRLCIPKEIRNTLHADVETAIEISTDGDTIVLKKYEPDNLEEKVREMRSIVNQQIDHIGLDKCMKIEKELDKIQELLQ